MPKITHLIFANGERYPVLLNDDGIPDYWPTLFATVTLRPLLTASAIENTLRNVLHLRLWEGVNGRDLAAEMSEGRFLSDEDIYSLRNHCMQQTRGIRKWAALKTSKHVAKISYSQPAPIQTIDHVSKTHASNRIAHISHFLHFVARTMLRRRENQVELKLLIEDTKRRLLAVKQKVKKKSASANRANFRAPPSANFEKLLAAVRPDSPDNPFVGKDIRIRNSLMFELLDQTGMRSGELLALRISDIDFQAGKVSIIRRHDDIDDPRSKQPVAKTLERTLRIKLSLARELWGYIMKVRSQIRGANKHPFIFVTHHSGKFCGRPISDTTFRNRIVKRATEICPDLFEEIVRHGFRHNFNYRLSNRIDAQNLAAKTDPTIQTITEKMEIQLRQEINGWASEKSAETYNKRHIREMADKIMMEDMKEQTKNINKMEKSA